MSLADWSIDVSLKMYLRRANEKEKEEKNLGKMKVN